MERRQTLSWANGGQTESVGVGKLEGLKDLFALHGICLYFEHQAGRRVEGLRFETREEPAKCTWICFDGRWQPSGNRNMARRRNDDGDGRHAPVTRGAGTVHDKERIVPASRSWRWRVSALRSCQLEPLILLTQPENR